MKSKPVGWRKQPARHALAAKGVHTRTRHNHMASLERPLLPELTPMQHAENAIRDMFLSKQYNGRVPHTDIQTMLESPRWRTMYGGRELKKAWDLLVKERYVFRGDNDWVWGME